MFHNLVHSTIEFIGQHPHLSLFIVFLIAFLEALPILGTIFPGSVIMTAIGTLLGSGVLPTGLTFGVAIFGAFLGDFIGYKVGLHYEKRLLKIWPFRTHPKWITVGEDFFKKHGGKSIIIGRFIGPVRSTIPLIAGIMKVRLPIFLGAGITSAILWSGLYILPGYLLGALSLELPPGKASQFLLVGVGIIFAIWFIFWSLNHFLKKAAKYTDRLIKVIWDSLIAHRYLKAIINIISDKTDPYDHTPLTRLLLAIFCFLLFVVIALNVHFHGPLTQFNQELFNLLQSFHTHDLTLVFAAITLFGEPKLLLAASAIFSLYLLVIKRSPLGWYFLLIAFLSAGCVEGIKLWIHNPRPSGLVGIDSGFSFPSGHTLVSTSILGFLAFTIAHQYKAIWYWIPYTLAAIVILLIGFSRLYLGAHWLTDVVASGLLGTSLLLLVIIIYTHFHDQNSKIGKGWPLISLIILLAGWAFYTDREIKETIQNAQPFYPQVQVKVQEWWQKSEYYSPKYYLNRFGKPIAPFNVQWEGSLIDIKDSLEKQGWEELHHRLSLKSLLQRLVNKQPEHHTPLLTEVYHNTQPALSLFKHLPNSETIIELRLWQANVEFSSQQKMLWLGIVSYHIPEKKLFTDPYKSFFITYEGHDALKEITPALAGWQSRIIQVNPTQHNKYLDHLDWKGSVLLVKNTNSDKPHKQTP